MATIWLNGRESQWTPGVGDGQGGLACCDAWGRKESDTTEQLIWSDVTPKIWSCITGLNTFMIRNLPASSLLLFIFWCSRGTHSLLNVFTKMTHLHLAMVSHDECCNLNLTPVRDAFQGGFEICEGHVVSYKTDTKFFVLRTHRKFIFQPQ